MSAYAHERRGRVMSRIAVATALLAAITFAVVNRDAQSRQTEQLAGLVFPGLDERAAQATTVRITTQEGAATAERGEAGWTIAERAGYPANPAALVELMAGLANLRFVERKTADPGRHHRLGLDDPSEAGTGVRIEALGENSAVIAALIVGDERRGGGHYIRFPGQAQTFAATGDLPRVDGPADLMDLEIVSVPREDVVAIAVTPEEGPGYALARADEPPFEFALSEPEGGWRLLNQSAASTLAGALSRLRFGDVRPAAELEGEPVGRHESISRDGFVVALDFYADGDARWAVIETNALPLPSDEDGAPPEDAEAVEPAEESADTDAEAPADTPDQAVVERAAAIAARTEGWAYLVPEFASERLVRALDAVAEPDTVE